MVVMSLARFWGPESLDLYITIGLYGIHGSRKSYLDGALTKEARA